MFFAAEHKRAYSIVAVHNLLENSVITQHNHTLHYKNTHSQFLYTNGFKTALSLKDQSEIIHAPMNAENNVIMYKTDMFCVCDFCRGFAFVV